MRVATVNQQAIRDLGFSREVEDALLKIGDDVAVDAAIAAPKLTGFGASTIHAEPGSDTKSAYVRVSWTEEAWYLKFSEEGSGHQKARPFLRPALYKKRVL